MELLSAVLLLLAGPHRNPFAYVTHDAPAPVIRQAKPKPAPVVVATPPAQPLTPPAPVIPEFPHRYLGTFGPDGDPFAVFAVDGQIVDARAGETIAGRYVVRAIGLESVVIAFVDAAGERRVPLAP